LLLTFALGFGTTVTESALLKVAEKAAEVAAKEDMIATDQQVMLDYATGLRLTVALSVGVAIVVGVLRII